jgi:RNA polymerase sigma-70 factor (ECF subfamily)
MSDDTTRAFERLLTTHADDLEAIVRRHADSEADRDDLRQEISIALWRAMPRFRGEASERTYVGRVALNRAITFRLRLARRRALLGPLDDDLAAPRADTGEHDHVRRRATLRDAVERLPAAQRELLAYAVAGHTPTQIAERTGRNAGAVRVALHRARAAVRAWLAETSGGRT